MSVNLSNSHLHFTLDPATSSWSLYTQTTETPSIEGARFNGLFRFPDFNWPHLGGLRPWPWRGSLDGADIFNRPANSAHGPLDMIIARVISGLDTLAITVEFALPKERPFLLIRLRVQNVGGKPFRVARLNPLFAGPLHRLGVVRLSPHSIPPTFFSNGWQSWSFAGTLTAKQRQPYTDFPPFLGPNNHNPHTPLSDFRRQFSGDMFGVLADPTHHSAIVAGFTSQREQFSSIDVVADPVAPSLRLRAQGDDVLLPPGQSLRTDDAYIQLIPEYDLDPLRDYAEAVARENNARVPAQTPVGWCSWYHYFDKVTEADVRANLEQIESDRVRLPLPLVQLDDGFEANVGDWFETNSKFPSGLQAVADSIRARNLTPGLWLAPFIAKPDSKLAREYPDWFLRSSNSFGLLPSNTGYVFNTFARGLDVTHPAVQNHTRKLIGTAVNEWGYPYLKLDFLYAAALPGKRHDSTRTRAQALRLGLELIREAAGPDTFLLGCGCPLGPAVGIMDGMRIGPDVDVRWRPIYKGLSLPFRDEPSMPSARNAIRNTLTRSPLHRRWWLNDPDCLLVRDTTQLTLDEVTALASVIALSGGMFLVSDDFSKLSPERRKLIEPLLPVLGQTALASDWLEKEMPEMLELPLQGVVGNWTVMGLFNWGDRPVDREFPVTGHVLDFWTQEYHRDGVKFNLPLHSGRLLAVRSVTESPQFIGSSLHFSQGSEITEWSAAERSLQFAINLGRQAEGYVTLSLPANPQLVNGNIIVTARIAPDIYRIPVSLNGRGEYHVEW